MLVAVVAVAGVTLVAARSGAPGLPQPTGHAVPAEVQNLTDLQWSGTPLVCREVQLGHDSFGIWVDSPDGTITTNWGGNARFFVDVRLSFGQQPELLGTVLAAAPAGVSIAGGTQIHGLFGRLEPVGSAPGTVAYSALVSDAGVPVLVPERLLTHCTVSFLPGATG